MKLFLDYNVDPNPRDVRESAPLTKASFRGHYETVKLLLERGAHLSPNNNHEKTPFLWACYIGSIEIVRALLDHSVQMGGSVTSYCIDFGWRDAQGNTALSYALDHGHHEIIQRLYERGILLDQNPHIDELFSNWSSDNTGDNVTATTPHLGPAIGWPFMKRNFVSSNERKSQGPSFKCQLCPERTFGKVASLLRHFQMAHCPDTGFKCGYPSCGKKYGRRDKLSEHCQASHGGSYREVLSSKQRLDPPPKCLVCQSPLGSWQALRSCVVRHSKEI